MNIAIITARGGSKRIPRKNIRPFCGKPMLAWPLEAAKFSGCFDHILISTEDEEIASVGRAHGALVVSRPLDLADDYSPAHKSARHALEWAINNIGPVSAFCHLYPTAPLLTAETIQKSMESIATGRCKAAWAMLRIPFPVYQFMIQGESGGLERLFSSEKVNMRSQDMPPAFIDVGQSYAFETAYFLQNEMLVGKDLLPIEVPLETALDIDTEDDWQRAEKIVKFLQAEK